MHGASKNNQNHILHLPGPLCIASHATAHYATSPEELPAADAGVVGVGVERVEVADTEVAGSPGGRYSVVLKRGVQVGRVLADVARRAVALPGRKLRQA